MAEFTMTIPADSISTTVNSSGEAATGQAVVTLDKWESCPPVIDPPV